MLKSQGSRFLIVALLVLLMFIPLVMVSWVVGSRQSNAERTLYDIGREWGGQQEITGPYIEIPVTAVIEAHEAAAEGGPIPVERKTEQRMTLVVMPEDFRLKADITTQTRSRGIYNVPVYQSAIEASFSFDFDDIEAALVVGETAHISDARLVVGVSNNAGLRGEAELLVAGAPLALEPYGGDRSGGIAAYLGDPRGQGDFTLRLGLNGAQSFKVMPAGRTTHVTIAADWPDPKFTGAFLPDASEISEAGFTASWTIPHLARSTGQVSRRWGNDAGAYAGQTFGFETLEQNGFYQKAYRSAAYSILFIALTFLCVLLVERGRDKPTHPVQYVLIGLAQMTFVLLMVAYAEQIGFGAAYVLSAGATVALITLYGFVGLKLGNRTGVLGGVLVVLYAVLYFILDSVDYALLAGSTLAFGALAAAMLMTRNEDWYAAKSAVPSASPEAKEGNDGAD